MKYCSGCRQFLPDSEFYRNRSKPDGLDYKCKACRGTGTARLQRDIDEIKRRLEQAMTAVEMACDGLLANGTNAVPHAIRLLRQAKKEVGPWLG